jgi:hypothetical protein
MVMFALHENRKWSQNTVKVYLPVVMGVTACFFSPFLNVSSQKPKFTRVELRAHWSVIHTEDPQLSL